MPNIKEIRDGGPNPAPTVAEMRESQRKGSEGIGHNEQSFNDSCKDFNMGCCINGEEENETPSQGASLPFAR